MKDLIIIGAGPAGVSAALYARARGLDLLLLERKRVGGLVEGISRVSHYAALEEVETGQTFSQRMERQLEQAGIVPVFEEVLSYDLTGEIKRVRTEKREYEAKAIILAMGSRPRALGIKNEKSVAHHCVREYEMDIVGRTVFVAGGSDGAAKEALFMSHFTKEVHIIQRSGQLTMIDEFRKQIEKSPDIHIHLNSRIVDFKKENGKLVQITVEKDGQTQDYYEKEGLGLFAFIGQVPNTEALRGQIALTSDGYIDAPVTTDIKGVYCAGDCREKKIRQIATAVADGCEAAIAAAAYLQ